jgi:hypothetical protein
LLISVGGVIKLLTALKVCLDSRILSSAHQAECLSWAESGSKSCGRKAAMKAGGGGRDEELSGARKTFPVLA